MRELTIANWRRELRSELRRLFFATATELGLTRREAAALCDVEYGAMSKLARGNLYGVSSDRLLKYLVALEHKVEVKCAGTVVVRAPREGETSYSENDFKSALAARFRAGVEGRGISYCAAAGLCGVSDVVTSQVGRGIVYRISSERLFELLARMGDTVELCVQRPSRTGKAVAQITVKVA